MGIEASSLGIRWLLSFIAYKQTCSIYSLKRDSAPQYTHAHTCVQLCTHVYTCSWRSLGPPSIILTAGLIPFFVLRFCSWPFQLASLEMSSLRAGNSGHESRAENCWCRALWPWNLVSRKRHMELKGWGCSHTATYHFSGCITRTNIPSTSHIHMILCVEHSLRIPGRLWCSEHG